MATTTDVASDVRATGLRTGIGRIVHQPVAGFAAVIALALAGLAASQMFEGYAAFIITTAALYVTVGVGLNILLGLSD
jgi:hypothetical protein